MTARLVLGAGLLACLGGGCATSGSSWTQKGYRQEIFGYEVAFKDPKAKSMSVPEWQLDNYYFDTVASAWQEKTADDYLAIKEEDLDQDGGISGGERRKEAIYDLKLTSRKNNGVIWAKAHSFLAEEADRELDVILTNYVDSLAGHGLYAQGNLFGVERTKVRSFTTHLTSKQIGPLGGHDALVGTIEIAEVDRLKQDPRSKSGIVRLALVKVRCLTIANCRPESQGYSTSPGGADVSAAGRELQRWPLVNCRGKPCHARVGLLVVGYYNSPDYFEAGLPDYEDLLKRISFPDAEPLPIPALRAEPAPAPAADHPPPTAPPASETPPASPPLSP